MQTNRIFSVVTATRHTFVFIVWPGTEDTLCRAATGYAVEREHGFNWYYAALACRRIRGLDEVEQLEVQDGKAARF